MRAQRIIFGFVTVFGTTLEVQAQRVLFVDQTAQRANDGSNWENAFADLQDALFVAESGDEVWVAVGTYRPDRGMGDRLATFRLVSGVGLYGGFAGWEECREERNWVVNETILSGDLNGDDGPLNCEEVSDCCREHQGAGCDEPSCEAIVCAADSDCCADGEFGTWDSSCAAIATRACCHLGSWRSCENSHFVTMTVDCGPGTVLDGFTVVGSYYNSQRDPYYGYITGAGIRCHSSSLTVANCRLRRNFGGAIAGDGNSVTISESSFHDTRPGVSGGLDNSDLSIVRCQFFDNAHNIAVNGGNLILQRCTFMGNTIASVSGIFVPGNGTVDGCLFMGGGGLTVTNARATVANSVFVGNLQHLGIYSSAVTVDNCLLTGSTQNTVIGDGRALFRNCAFVNNAPYLPAIRFGFGNLAVLNCTIFGNGTIPGCCGGAGGGGGIDLSNGSAQVLNSIIWGNGGSIHQTDERNQINLDAVSTLEIDYSIVEGWSGALGGPGNDGNFGADPLFVDPDGPDDIPGTEDDDVRLSPGSPAINAGLSSSSFLTPTDLDGHSRILCGNVDIGAYEFGIGDFDCNRTVNLADFAWFPYCLTGPMPGVEAVQTNIGERDPPYVAPRINRDATFERLDAARSLPVAARKLAESDRFLTGAARKDGSPYLPSPFDIRHSTWGDKTAPSRSRLGSTTAAGCEAFDFNTDSAIDLLDLAGFQRAFSP